MDISTYIRELLFKHDIVTLPSIGSFIKAYHSANIDIENYSFVPPSKTIVFNPSLKADDSVLSQYIATKNNISSTEAKSSLELISTRIKMDLDLNKPVELKKFGVLKKGLDGNFYFVDNRKENYLTDSFGIDSFKLKMNNEEQPKKIQPIPQKEQTVIEKPAVVVEPAAMKAPERRSGSSVLDFTNAAIIFLILTLATLFIYYIYLVV